MVRHESKAGKGGGIVGGGISGFAFHTNEEKKKKELTGDVVLQKGRRQEKKGS